VFIHIFTNLFTPRAKTVKKSNYNSKINQYTEKSKIENNKLVKSGVKKPEQCM